MGREGERTVDLGRREEGEKWEKKKVEEIEKK